MKGCPGTRLQWCHKPSSSRTRPPSGPRWTPRTSRDDIERSAARARTAGAAEIELLLDENTLWARTDAQHAVASRQALNVDRIAAFLRGNRWDLPALVAECPRPVTLLAATGPGTALAESGRTAIIDALPASRLHLTTSGHSIHRDRPALWLNAVLEAARSAGSA